MLDAAAAYLHPSNDYNYYSGVSAGVHKLCQALYGVFDAALRALETHGHVQREKSVNHVLVVDDLYWYSVAAEHKWTLTII